MRSSSLIHRGLSKTKPRPVERAARAWILQSLTTEEARLKRLQAEQTYLKSLLQDRVYITPAAVRATVVELRAVLADAVANANGVLRRIFPEHVKMAWEPAKG
jgi:hypothetical protein